MGRSWKVSLPVALAVVLTLGTCGFATTIDFEGAPTGAITGLEYAGQGVLFSSEGGSGAQEVDYGLLYTELLTSDDWYHPLLIDFVNPANSSEDWIVTSVSMQNHFAEDYWVVTAYDLSGDVLATDVVNYEEKWVTFSGVGGIHSIKLDAHDTAFAMDNLTFEGLAAPGPAIPAPGAILLGMLGTGVVGWLRRRRTL